MSISLNAIEEVRAEESRLLGKIEEHAKTLQRQDPRLSHAAAFAKATAALPRTYERYAELRTQMIALRMKPTLIK